jgi:GLPGLI family protein
MKNKSRNNYLLLLLLVLTINIYSQDTKAIIDYKGTLEIDMEKILKDLPEKFHDQAKDTYGNIKPVFFKLQVKNEESLFQQIEELKVENEPVNLGRIIGETGKFYINSKSKKTLREKEVMGDLYSIYSHLDSINWNLTQEEKKIGKYICYKATTSIEKITFKGTIIQHITAWYTPELNIPHGPIGFGGLPGLIIELRRDGTRNYVYSMIKIALNLEKKINIKEPNDGILVNQKEFYDIERNITNGILERRK